MQEHERLPESSWSEDTKSFVPVTLIIIVLFAFFRTNPEAHLAFRLLASAGFAFCCFFVISMLMWVLHGFPIRRLATLDSPLAGVLRICIVGALTALLFAVACVIVISVYNIQVY